jgi:hypothetical protein
MSSALGVQVVYFKVLPLPDLVPKDKALRHDIATRVSAVIAEQTAIRREMQAATSAEFRMVRERAVTRLGFQTQFSSLQSRILIPKYYDPELEEQLKAAEDVQNWSTIGEMRAARVLVKSALVIGGVATALIAGEGWHHSGWDSLEVVQSSADKVHIAVSFTRYRADGEKYASYPSLYIVERGESGWGVRARSSFAP